MRKKKKEKKINLQDIETAIAAGLLMTRFAWKIQCKQHGWKLDSPSEATSFAYNAVTFTQEIIGINVQTLKLKDLFTKENSSRAGIKLKRDGYVYITEEIDFPLLEEILKIIPKKPNPTLPQKISELFIETRESMEREIAWKNNQFN